MSNEKQLEEAFGSAMRELTERFGEEAPRIKDILKRAQAGEIDETQAMGEMMQEVAANPALAKGLEKVAASTLSVLREDDGPVEVPGVFQPPSGLPRLDPLWEAKLHERIQFDDDAPELRRGPLPPGVAPAVPVAGTARSPVALGAALRDASQAVLDETRALLAEAETARLLEAPTDEVELFGDGNNMPCVIADGTMAAVVQPKGYEAGRLPALRETKSATGAELAAIPKDERRELAWSAFMTTQGRRSMLPHIGEMIAEKLLEHGVEVVHTSFRGALGQTGVVTKAHWTIDTAGSGPKNTNDDFDILRTAAMAMAAELAAEAPDGGHDLEVVTVDAYDERRIGWAALLRRR